MYTHTHTHTHTFIHTLTHIHTLSLPPLSLSPPHISTPLHTHTGDSILGGHCELDDDDDDDAAAVAATEAAETRHTAHPQNVGASASLDIASAAAHRCPTAAKALILSIGSQERESVCA